MGESATTSADLDTLPSRRGRRTRVRRHTHQVQTTLVALVAAAVAVTTGGLAWWGVQTIADSRGGTALDVIDRGPVAVLPSTPVVMLAQPAASGGLVAVTLVALAPSGSGGFVILLPPGALAEVPGLGRATLAEAWGAGGLDLVGSAVEGLFQISLPREELADEAAWAALTASISPFPVDFANGVRVAGPNGVLETIVPAGGAPVAAADVARILAVRTASESELARLVRHEEFWTSLLEDLADAGADPVVVPTTVRRRPGDPVTAPTPLTAAEILRGLASGSTQVATISTSRAGGVGEGERYEPDVTEIRLLAARAMPGVVSPAGDGWRVRVVNPTGDRDVLEAAASALLASGANLVIASDSRDARPAETVIRYDSLEPSDAGRSVAEALGFGAPAPTDDRIEGVDVTVILGNDFARAVAAASARNAAASAATTTGPTTSATVAGSSS